MVIAADYPFLDIFWTMIVFFFWVAWLYLLITVFADIFRRHDLSGLAKVAWLIFVLVLPFVGVFIYLIAHSEGMTERAVRQSTGKREHDAYLNSAAGQIEQAQQLRDSGSITEAEFEALKQKALA